MKLNAERRATAAGASGIRVIEDKTLTVQAALIIEVHADEIEIALLVDHELYAVVLNDFVISTLSGIKIQLVGHAGASALNHFHAQERIGSQVFIGLFEVANLLSGAFGNLNHRAIIAKLVGSDNCGVNTAFPAELLGLFPGGWEAAVLI